MLDSLSSGDNLQTRGHTDLRLVCHKYESHHEHREHRRPGDHNTGNGDHRKHHHDHADDDHVTLVAHVTVGW